MNNLNVSGSNYTVEKGSNLWSVAKTICKNGDAKVSNAAIVKEMTKLATLNGCKDFEELGEKFKKIGSQIKLDAQTNPINTKLNSSLVAKTICKNDATNISNATKAHEMKNLVIPNVKKQPKAVAQVTPKIQAAPAKAVVKHVAPTAPAKVAPQAKAHAPALAIVPTKSLKVNPFVTKLDSQKNVSVNESTASASKAVFKPIINSNVKSEIEKINNMPSDAAKVIEFNKQHATSNYIIVNKQTSTATVYSPNGKAIKSIEIGTGQQVGDSLNNGYGKNGTANKTTPAGEFALNSRGAKGYGQNIFILGKEYMVPGSRFSLGLHIIPSDLISKRLPLFGNGNLKDNRMSAGCMNMTQKDFNELTKEVSVGAKLYVLPEEKGNSLKLSSNDKGELKFVQTKYKGNS